RIPGTQWLLPGRQYSVFWNKSGFLLASENFFPVSVPAIIKPPLIFINPFAAYLMRRMGGAGCEVEEKRLFGIGRLLIGNVFNRLICQLFIQMLFIRPLFYRRDSLNQVWIPLIRSPSKKTKKMIKPPACRIPVERTRSIQINKAVPM